jgi:hypothetical protein
MAKKCKNKHDKNKLTSYKQKSLKVKNRGTMIVL